jgi:hypothetical protein
LRRRREENATSYPGYIHCPHCGQYHPEEMTYCPTAGLPIYRDEPAEPGRPAYNLKLLIGIGAGLFLLFGAAAVVAGVLLLRQSFSNPPASPPDITTLFPPTAQATFTAGGFGGGEASLTPFPTNSLGPELTATPQDTPHPTITTTALPWEACQGADYLSRVHVGDTVQVAENPPLANRVRSRADLNASVLGYIQPGEEALVLDGPGCSNNWVWWKVKSKESGLTGWTAEGDQNAYWLVPVAP